MLRASTLKLLFTTLRDAGYERQPQTLDRLLSFRRNPAPFRPLTQCFGLGLTVSESELLQDGLSSEALTALLDEHFIMTAGADDQCGRLLKPTMAVSGNENRYIVHDHWPPVPNRIGGYVHYSAESLWLSEVIATDLERFRGKHVLDLGCSSGALSFEVAPFAKEVLGLDIAERAIQWGRACSEANGFRNTRLEVAPIGQSLADKLAGHRTWDFALMNPPMVIPSNEAAYPHRDGGRHGIEIPFLFLDFAHRHLKRDGEIICLVTNPIVLGRSAFFEKLNRQKWAISEKKCFHPYFNQEVARKQGYAKQGIQNVELWYLRLRRL